MDLQGCRGLLAISPRGDLADLADRWDRGDDVEATLAKRAGARKVFDAALVPDRGGHRGVARMRAGVAEGPRMRAVGRRGRLVGADQAEVVA